MMENLPSDGSPAGTSSRVPAAEPGGPGRTFEAAFFVAIAETDYP